MISWTYIHNTLFYTREKVTKKNTKFFIQLHSQAMHFDTKNGHPKEMAKTNTMEIH